MGLGCPWLRGSSDRRLRRYAATHSVKEIANVSWSEAVVIEPIKVGELLRFLFYLDILNKLLLLLQCKHSKYMYARCLNFPCFIKYLAACVHAFSMFYLYFSLGVFQKWFRKLFRIWLWLLYGKLLIVQYFRIGFGKLFANGCWTIFWKFSLKSIFENLFLLFCREAGIFYSHSYPYFSSLFVSSFPMLSVISVVILL